MRVQRSRFARVIPIVSLVGITVAVLNLPLVSAAGSPTIPGAAVVGSSEPSESPSPSPTASPTATPGAARSPVQIDSAIAAGLAVGEIGFGPGPLTVGRVPGGATVTLRWMAEDGLVGRIAEIWVRTGTHGWQLLTHRRFGWAGEIRLAEIRFVGRVSGWTGFRLRYPGDASHAGAWGRPLYVNVR